MLSVGHWFLFLFFVNVSPGIRLDMWVLQLHVFRCVSNFTSSGLAMAHTAASAQSISSTKNIRVSAQRAHRAALRQQAPCPTMPAGVELEKSSTKVEHCGLLEHCSTFWLFHGGLT